MPLFLWKPSYELGVPEIDSDHRQLVGMINQLYKAMKDGQGQAMRDQTIDSLISYIGGHFETEESFMRLCNYPLIGDHLEAHRAFREELQQMARGREAGSSPSPTELLAFLCDWMRDHVTTADKELAVFLEQFKA